MSDLQVFHDKPRSSFGFHVSGNFKIRNLSARVLDEVNVGERSLLLDNTF
jgi:hypothetical protein